MNLALAPKIALATSWLVGACIISSGCIKMQIAEQEEALAQLRADHVRLETRHGALRNQRHDVETEVKEQQARARRRQSQLDQVRRAMVAGWRGDPQLMNAAIKRGRVPKRLATLVRTTQKELSRETPEMRLKAAFARKDVAAAREAIQGWEDRPESLELLSEVRTRDLGPEIPSLEQNLPESCERPAAQGAHCDPVSPTGGPGHQAFHCRTGQSPAGAGDPVRDPRAFVIVAGPRLEMREVLGGPDASVVGWLDERRLVVSGNWSGQRNVGVVDVLHPEKKVAKWRQALNDAPRIERDPQESTILFVDSQGHSRKLVVEGDQVLSRPR